MKTLLTALIGISLLAVGTSLHAQVPQLISYQGRVVVGTSNFNGSGQFKFALVNAAGTTTYWSNDGTSTAGSQPTAAVALTVTKGLYSLLLGDTTLPNMTAVPASVFSNADVRLRVWFDDGTNGSQLLAPDQRIAAVGYAMIAGTVADGAITSTKIANNAVGSSQLASGVSITGTLTGNASTSTSAVTATSAGSFTGTLAGDVTGPQSATVVSLVGTSTAANVHSAELAANAATNANTASTIVKRDGSGNFSAGAITLGSGIALPATSSATVGVITQGGTRMLHSFGTNNIFAGDGAGNFTLTGADDTGIGDDALGALTSGVKNTAVGSNALQVNTTGQQNTAVGFAALALNVSANQNSAVGELALTNTIAANNTAMGYAALVSNTGGTGNTAFGWGALHDNVSGGNNTALGKDAGTNLTTGNNNIDIGNGGVAGEASAIRIGTSGTQTKTFVAGIRGITTGVNDAVPVVIDSTGQLGTVSSSRRYKEDINDMGDVSGRVESLRPVTFRYKAAFSDGGKPLQFGLIAEEVAEIFPELVVFNADGLPETVKYQDLVPLLLNEVQKLRGEKEELNKRLEKVEAAITNISK